MALSKLFSNTNIYNNQSTNYKESNRKELLVKYISIIKKILSDSNLEINTNEASSIACEIMNSTENPEKISIDHNQVIEMAKELLRAKNNEDNETGIILSEKEKKTVFTLEENMKKRKPYELTDRELEVIQLLANGYTSKEIANELNIDRNTVETYKDRIKSKLDCKSAIEIVVFAYKNKLIH